MSKPLLTNILAALARIAPPELAEEWDRVGLHIGDESAQVDHLTVSLDPSLEAVKAAGRDKGAGCLVCHHPLFFKPISKLDLAAPLGGVVAQAIKTEVAIIAAHTNLDWTAGGVNDILADLLGLENPEPLIPNRENPAVGVGRLGRIAENTTLSALAGRVRDVLGLAAVRLTGDPRSLTGPVAICGGSGGSLIGQAVKSGAGVLVTGEIGYHDLLEAQALGLAVIQAGHRGTEAPVVKVLAAKLSEILKEQGLSIPVRIFAEPEEPFALI